MKKFLAVLLALSMAVCPMVSFSVTAMAAGETFIEKDIWYTMDQYTMDTIPQGATVTFTLKIRGDTFQAAEILSDDPSILYAGPTTVDGDTATCSVTAIKEGETALVFRVSGTAKDENGLPVNAVAVGHPATVVPGTGEIPDIPEDPTIFRMKYSAGSDGRYFTTVGINPYASSYENMGYDAAFPYILKEGYSVQSVSLKEGVLLGVTHPATAIGNDAQPVIGIRIPRDKEYGPEDLGTKFEDTVIVIVTDGTKSYRYELPIRVTMDRFSTMPTILVTDEGGNILYNRDTIELPMGKTTCLTAKILDAAKVMLLPLLPTETDFGYNLISIKYVPIDDYTMRVELTPLVANASGHIFLYISETSTPGTPLDNVTAYFYYKVTGDPSTPTGPEEPDQPNKPTDPEEPDQPSKPDKPNKPTTPGKVTESPEQAEYTANKAAEAAAVDLVREANAALAAGKELPAKAQSVTTAAGTSITAVPVKLYGLNASLSVPTVDLLANGKVGLKASINNGDAEVILPAGFIHTPEPGRIGYPLGFQKDPRDSDLMTGLVKGEGAKTETCKLGGNVVLPATATVTIKTKLVGKVNVYYWNDETRKATLIASPTAADGRVTFAASHLGNFILTTGTI